MIADILKFLFPNLNPLTDYEIADSGGGMELVSWNLSIQRPSTDEIDAARLPAAKSMRITAINTECRARLITRFGEAHEQVSRSLGIYGVEEKTASTNGMAAMIDASNIASNEVLAATTILDVEAVTVTWPVI